MMSSLDFSVLGMIFLFFSSNNSVIRASFLLFVCIPPPPYWLSGKEPACQCRRHKRDRFDPWIGKIPWRRAWQPLQYSCLENPMDRGAWQTMVHGVSKSWIQLKPLSIHSKTCYRGGILSLGNPDLFYNEHQALSNLCPNI